MKSIHFCTSLKLESLKKLEDGEIFSTVRTGWNPTIYSEDIIKINERIEKKDYFLFNAEVSGVFPVKYKKLIGYATEEDREEIGRYNKKFNPEHWFFRIFLIKTENKKGVNNEKHGKGK